MGSRPAKDVHTMGSRPAKDVHTLSNYTVFKTKHTRANLRVDFDKRIFSGDVQLHLQSASETPEREVYLDTSYLDIQDVQVQQRPCKWQLMPRSEPLGSKLVIHLDETPSRGDQIELNIKTSTTDKCTALGWMDAVQSRSRHPFVYSQCQAIHARSMLPCQDTPSVKSTYEFNISSPLPVLASGLATHTSQDTEVPRNKVYSFRQDIPIPTYLFAIASGELETAPIGPRSKVAATPNALAAAKWEFEESIEKYIQNIERIVYPYQWKEYNVLVLPPSFPYGGMENPVYTYVTPTTVSGDRENVDVVAHELSHSYSGNYVTAATWNDFWLNEGWTTYLERRLQAALFGEPHRDFSAIIGWKALTDAVNTFGATHEFTKLLPDMNGVDPDDAYSTVAYEKGYTFLSHLEATVGKGKWNEYIPHYFTTFAKRSLTSYEFKDNLLAFFASDSAASTALQSVNWDEWFYTPGLPLKPKFNTELVDVCYQLAAKWTEGHIKPEPSDIAGWTANQKVVFLDTIQHAIGSSSSQHLSAARIREMGEIYAFAHSKNVEVSSRYFSVALAGGAAESVSAQTADLLANVGRMKFVRPLYKYLNKADRQLALETFENNRGFYHPICRSLVAKDLGV